MAEAERGFTLAEIVIVLAICGFLTAFSLPLFTRFRASFLLDPHACGIASELRKTQALAFSRHQSADWNVDRYDLPPGIFPCNSKTFAFASSGFPLPGGSGTQGLATVSGGIRKIIVSSAGRIRIE